MTEHIRRPFLLMALVWVGALTACSTTRPWVNEPLRGGPRTVDVRDIAQRDSSALFAVTLSGGGARAAAFAHGVLLELRDTRCCWVDRDGNMLDAVDVVSGVSGGSIAAAHLAAYGSGGLERFEREFLRQDFQEGLIGQLLRPRSLYDLTSPWFGRSHLLQRRLDVLFEGKTYADVERRPRHPQLVVTATDMSLGTGFDFTAEQFALICSDLSSVPLSFAVAASSSVPLVLSPMTLRNHRVDCPAGPLVARNADGDDGGSDYRTRLFRSQEESYLDARSRPYIHLVDGGLADNLGVRRLLDRALAGGGMAAAFNEVRIATGSIRRLVIITVNSERDPEQRIDESDRVPGTAAVVDALLFGAGNRATVETQEFLVDIARRWQSEVKGGRSGRFRGFAGDADIFLIQVNLRDATEARRMLLQVPTALSISGAEVDGLIAAGRQVLRASPEFQRLNQSLGLLPTPP